MNGEIAYFDDIVKELSRDFNIPEKEIREVCSLSLDYVKELVADKETLSVYMSGIGSLYFSTRLGRPLKSKLSNIRSIENNRHYIERIDHRLKTVQELDYEKGSKFIKHNQRPFVYKFKGVVKDVNPEEVYNSMRPEKIWAEVSRIQNEKNNG